MYKLVVVFIFLQIAESLEKLDQVLLLLQQQQRDFLAFKTETAYNISHLTEKVVI